MEGTPAVYLGRLVSKEHFRAFIYAPDGSKKLVESWDEFEAHMQTGVWFATNDEAKRGVEVEKPKPKPRPSRAKKPIEDVPVAVEDELYEPIPDDAAFEVMDDFLPKG